MRLKTLLSQCLLTAFFVLLMQGLTAQTTCHDFETGLGNWDGFDAEATWATDNTTSNGTKFMKGRDQGGVSWLRNVADFGAMNCGGKICWKFKVINDDVSGQSINISPKVTLFSGVVGNMDLFATFTASSIVVTENSAWVEVCASFAKTSPLGAMPAGWVMGNGGTVFQWNHLLTTVNGIAFSTDVNPSNDPGEVIGIDDVCVTVNPPNSCCDATDTGNFTIETKCSNGALIVTVTDPDPDPMYHSWSLMQTSVAGQTSDAVTLNGGNPLVPTQTAGGSATFTITDFSKSYYIKHVIYGDFTSNCFYAKEVRTPIELPKADMDFYFMDWLNLPRNAFCYGERIRLYAYSDIPIASYYMDAWRRPIGSPDSTPFNWYGGAGWTNGAPSTIDVTTVFAGLSTPVYFEPGYEYQIKLAASNPQLCIGWTEVLHNFTVVCCDNYLNADFCVDAVTGSNNYTLKIKNYNTYSHIGAVHEWYVLSSPNATGGPYTQVTSSTAALPEFNIYTQANYNLYYTVVHKLKTKCGEICMVKTQYQTGGRGEVTNGFGLTGCNATKIDCKWIDSVWNPCPVPTGLFGSCARNVLVWNPVAGASGYVVEISFNDPKCCRTAYQPTGMRYEISGSSLLLWSIATPKYDCFRWRVKTKCSNKESDWSAWQCYYCREGVAVQGHDGEEPIGKRDAVKPTSADNALQPQVVPNPSHGNMMLSMQAPGDLVLSAEVFNVQGIRVTTIARNMYRGGQFNYKLSLGHTAPKGIYTIVFNTNYGTFRKKIIVH